MTIPTLFGVMASSSPATPGATYIISQYGSITGTSVNVPFTGMAVGNLAVIYIQNASSTPTTPSGWAAFTTTDWTLGYKVGIFWKVLTSTDISIGYATVSSTDSGGQYGIAAYGGASMATLKTTTQSAGGATTLVCTGFTKAANSKGILAYVYDRDTGSTSITGPAIMTKRFGPYISGFFAGSEWDILNVSTYTSGSTLTFSGFTATYEQYGVLIELT